MATISAEQVKKLRDQTGAGMMECKNALSEANGDFDEANTILRKRGLASAAKKAGRSANEGLIGQRLSADNSAGTLVEVNCESDFVARTPDFQKLVQDVLTQIDAAGATSAQYVSRDVVPAVVLDKEKSIYRAQMENSGKPANVIEKIVEGKLGAFFSQVVLPDQESIFDPKMKVKDRLAAAN